MPNKNKYLFTEVIANNGIADFKILNPDGSFTYAQAKVGYGNTKIDWSLYDGQTIVIDNGNKELIQSARAAGKNVIESNITEAEAKSLAKSMQLESKITGKTNATITPKMHSAGKIAKQSHLAGVDAAKKGAAFGAGFSIGSNMVELLDGEKDLGEAVKDVTKDTAVASTAVGGAVAAVAAAPVVAAGAVIGGVFTIGKKIFGR